MIVVHAFLLGPHIVLQTVAANLANIFYQLLLLNCRLEVLHKVNNLVKEWIRDISIKKVCCASLLKLIGLNSN